MKETHLAGVYRRLAVRLGKQKAIKAVAHRLHIAIYHILKERVPYRERGSTLLSETVKLKLAGRMQRKLEELGFTVHLSPVASPAPQPA